MISTAYINLWNHRIGAIAWDSDTGLGSFEFEPDFLKARLDVAPIKMPAREAEGKIFSFPELRDSNTFKGLPGLLADILPDNYGNALINVWLTRQGRPPNSLNPVEMLCFIGKRGMGAIDIEPAIPETSDSASKIELDRLIGVVEEILSNRMEFSTSLTKNREKAFHDILKIGSSAGGARAKALIAFNPDTGEVRSGQANALPGFTHWILKFDGVKDSRFETSKGYGRIEMAYSLMARDAGIEMTECRLLEENGRAHFMTKRFDRANGNEKIHVQSFCAMQHYDFQDVGFYSYEQLFETMRLLRLPYPQAEQLFRRMVFNVMGRNCDDHTKNFAFLMDSSGTWRLSPAFDISYAYKPGNRWISQHAMSVNGKREHITKDDLLQVAYQMNIKKARSIIETIADVIRSWPDYAKRIHVDNAMIQEIRNNLLPGERVTQP